MYNSIKQKSIWENIPCTYAECKIIHLITFAVCLYEWITLCRIMQSHVYGL